MKHLQPTPNPITRWFASKSNKEIAFTSSVVLIGILFVVAIVAILSGNGPSADEVTSPVGRLAKRLTIGNGALNYTQNGQNKTKPSNSVDIRIKAIPKITYKLQGNNKAPQTTSIRPVITVKTTGGADIIAAANALTATATAGLNATQLQSTFDNDDYRNNVNATNADLRIKMKVPNYLSKTVTVTDPKSVVINTPLLAGNFIDTGESEDFINEADTAKCGPAFKEPINDTNRVCDVNFDGLIDEADTAIWGPNWNLRGTSE